MGRSSGRSMDTARGPDGLLGVMEGLATADTGSRGAGGCFVVMPASVFVVPWYRRPWEGRQQPGVGRGSLLEMGGGGGGRACSCPGVGDSLLV